MSRQYAVKDRDQTIHPEASRKAAQRDQKAYGGMIMQSKASGHDLTWKPYRVITPWLPGDTTCTVTLTTPRGASHLAQIRLTAPGGHISTLNGTCS